MTPVQMGGTVSVQTLPQQITGNQQTGNAQQTAGTQQTGANNQANAFAGLTTGDTIQAQVTDVSGKVVTMETSNGTPVQAQFPEGVTINPGDLVEMTMVGKNGNSVDFKLTAVNGQSINLESSELQVYLMENGIAPSKMNEGAAQVLMRANISPTPRNVAQLVQVATSLPEIPTSVAVMMAENNIPPTQENANILMQWASQPAAMGQDIQDLAGMVAREVQTTQFPQVFQDTVLQQATPEQAQVLRENGGLEQLAQNLTNQMQQQGLENMTPRQVQSTIHAFVSQLPVDGEQAAALENLLTQSFAQSSETVRSENTPQQLMQANQTVQQEAQPQTVQTQTPQNAAQTQGETRGVQPEAGQTQPSQPSVQGEQTQQPVQQNAGAVQEQPAAQTPRGDAQMSAAVPAQAEEAAPQNTQTGRTQTQAAPQGEAAPTAERADAGRTQSTPRQIFMPAGEQNPPSAEQAVRREASDVMTNLGKMVVHVREGSIPDDAQTLRDGVRSQQQLANLTKDGVARMFGQTSAAAQKASDMSAQVRLGNQIDQFFYAQIPFQTMQQNGTAELYVFQRQGQKAEAERTQVTVLIGLDTQHMGRVETVLRSLEDHLSIEFRVENKRVQTFFEDSLKDFSEEMGELGFPLDSVHVRQIKEKVTPLNAMQVMEPKQEIHLRGLDIEA